MFYDHSNLKKLYIYTYTFKYIYIIYQINQFWPP